MFRQLSDKVKKNKKIIFLFTIILLTGIFLRTYKFHDWLKFTHDQARDSRIVTDILDHKTPLPLLGPDAGGTKFLLGPIHYYFSYAAALIFGNYPTKLAYPSLFAGILAIPLLFIFMRQYFDRRISLAASAILSVSYFFVLNSRFSWNPNLIPFFILLCLYSLLKLLNDKDRPGIIWSILAGVSLGVGIQLHAFFLVVMSALTFLAFAYLVFRKNKGIWKKIALVIALVLITNVPQIISEFQTNFQNSRNFFSGASKKSSSRLGDSLLWTSACQIQANTYFISSIQNVSSLPDKYACKSILKAPDKKLAKNLPYYFGLAISTIFSLLGYFLLGYFFKKEKDEKNKNFLGLIITFNALSFLAFFNVAQVMYLSYFILILPVPFVLLGLYLKITLENIKYWGKTITLAAVIFLIATSLARDRLAFQDYEKGIGNSSRETTLQDIELISQYILKNSKNFNEPYFCGKGTMGGRFSTPLKYFIQESGKDIKLVWNLNDKEIKPGIPIFYIKNSTKKIIPGEKIDGREVITGQRFWRQVVLILKN